ncbi:anti-sigma factor family protein [Amycolatopsis suaedae]|uniref:Zf-HC2 domain-containing protein n=1 Tax=Amycolatopsis suaedae TaxID=2510978 RepID=A0A4Q7JEL7_9PSEU|nr:zf-HC2 domain-containing protein [Amycolatopsis suaedae]RZQ65612.1 zf-HC2 domain-containing protein [Amycolatopsis suaedae]
MRDPFATYDAAYVLGSLSPEDRHAYETHMKTCRECSQAVREIAGLPGLLSQVDPAAFAAEPPPQLRPSLMRGVRRYRRRRLWLTVASGVTAAAACAALVVSLVVLPPRDDTVGTAMTPLGEFPVQASVELADRDWGSQIDMACSYRGGRVGDYVLVAVRSDGAVDQLASWHAVPQDTARISVGTPLRRADIDSLEIRSASGRPLMRWQP